jgi:6-pyruvoyltetrahydropterin/6-carboxytetrahydropterin synthase
MYLTISKRFEISSSARLYRPDRDEAANSSLYGLACRGEHGHGYNYVATFVFHGPVDAKTGMMLNISLIKERIKALLDDRYDHKFLNLDTPPFTSRVPTPENIARQLLEEAAALFGDQPADAVACHFRDSRHSGAIAFSDGRIERLLGFAFSAARRTFSPNLSPEENEALFGQAAAEAGHGHNYSVVVTLESEFDSDSGVIVPYEESHGALAAIHEKLDHKNLNRDVPGLDGQPMTTESLARYILTELRRSLPVGRIRLNERHDFFAEYLGDDRFRLGAVQTFHAAHRLYSPLLSEEENLAAYGKCNNPHGHGHEYRVEATVNGPYNERSGTLYDFAALVGGLGDALAPWDYRRLDLECEEFKGVPTTGENIVGWLWPRLDRALDNRLCRARLWETANNRFTLRR